MKCWTIKTGNALQGDWGSECPGRSMGIGVFQVPREARQEPERLGAGGRPGRQASARAHRKLRAWLAPAKGKFQSLEAVPWGCHSVFSLGFIKQTITKQPSEHNNDKNHPESGSLQK